jgi:hypothetical protein
MLVSFSGPLDEEEERPAAARLKPFTGELDPVDAPQPASTPGYKAILDRYAAENEAAGREGEWFAPEKAALRNWGNNMQASTYGLIGLGADWLGAEETRDKYLQKYLAEQEQIQANMRPEYTWEHEGDPLKWARYTLANFAPDLIGTLGTGALVKKGVQEIVERGTKDLIKDKADDVAAKIVADRAKTKARAGTAGALGGALAYNEGIMVGQTYGQAYEEALKQGKTADDINTGRVVGYATAAAGLDTASDLLAGAAGKFGPLKGTMDLLDSSLPGWKGRLVNAGTKGTAAGLVGGTTETLQSGLQQMGSGKTFEDSTFWNEGEFAAGVLGEGTAGAGLAAMRRPTADVRRMETQRQAEADMAARAQEAVASEQARLVQEGQEEAMWDRYEGLQAEQEAARAAAEDGVGRERLAYGPKFTPKNEWVKQREAQFETRLTDEGDELKAEYDRWRVQTKTYDDTTQTRRKFRKAYEKTNKVDVNAEYEAALDEFAARNRTQGIDPEYLDDYGTSQEGLKAQKPAKQKGPTDAEVATMQEEFKAEQAANTEAKRVADIRESVARLKAQAA